MHYRRIWQRFNKVHLYINCKRDHLYHLYFFSTIYNLLCLWQELVYLSWQAHHPFLVPLWVHHLQPIDIMYYLTWFRTINWMRRRRLAEDINKVSNCLQRLETHSFLRICDSRKVVHTYTSHNKSCYLSKHAKNTLQRPQNKALMIIMKHFRSQ